MGCKACGEAFEQGQVAPFRWGAANIGIVGCREHVTEVLDVLREAQAAQRRQDEAG